MPNSISSDGRLRIVFIGDVVGRYGRRLLSMALPHIRKSYQPDVIIANGENAAGGLGINRKTAKEMFDAGVQIITGGNHIWDKKEAVEYLPHEDKIVRPMNFPKVAPGRTFIKHQTNEMVDVLVISLQGRVFMEPVVDNPFTIINDFLKDRKEKVILVDFHAEATAEKQAMGFYLDGKVSAVLGTHTHVQTSDARILQNGTAYQTDVGMTGALDSVIGMKKEPIIYKMVTGINQRFEVSKSNPILDMTLIDINPKNGKAVRIEYDRIYESAIEGTFED